ncbi:MAG TPA: DUF1501 domain-containing protein [Opitutaceae bacterium]|nr:DUF1501 domain-containing protein [Opitutaceae bacterium]
MTFPDPLSGKSPLLSRREALRRGFYGAAGALLAHNFSLRALAALPAAPKVASPPAKSVIQIWLWGGPCHLDTFDPKPDAGYDYTGPLKNPIETNVSGIRICELLPLLARQADKYSLIRGLTHNNNAHETASYIVQTGRAPGDRYVFPSAGAVVSLFKGYDAGYRGLIPPYIVLTELQGRFSEAGFLGQRYQPFATGGDPARSPFAVEGVVAPGLSEARQRSRRELLGRLNTLAHALPDAPALTASARAETQAYDLILGDAGKVFDVASETDALKDRYGRNTFGQSCLVARRLVEHGVPYVTINYKGWDTHKRHFETMRAKLPELDKGLATLLQDLADRGLLESTVVWCGGEFGRTPRVQWEAPWNGGRGHWGQVFSALLAGGGFQGGQAVGASDAFGEEVHDRPVFPSDLIGSLYEKLGIAADARLPHPEGLPVAAFPPPSDKIKTAGRLREIM